MPAHLFKMNWLLMSIVLLCIMAMALYAVIGEYYGKEKPPAGRSSERNAAFAQSMDITYRAMKHRGMMAGR